MSVADMLPVLRHLLAHGLHGALKRRQDVRRVPIAVLVQSNRRCTAAVAVFRSDENDRRSSAHFVTPFGTAHSGAFGASMVSGPRRLAGNRCPWAFSFGVIGGILISLSMLTSSDTNAKT
jgi:hypothetical protein